MNAIVGVVSRSPSRPISLDLRKFVISSLGRRTQGEVAYWGTDSEFLAETHPFSNSGVRVRPPTMLDNYCLVGDIRIDNRRELADSLSLPDTRFICDKLLVLHLFARWGPDSCSRLVGDFAFAIWNSVDRSLFCARDQLGVRPLFYRPENNSMYFGTEVKLFDQRAGTTNNEVNVSAFLAGHPHYPHETNVPNVFRLPAGHHLHWRNGHTQVNCYWKLELGDEVNTDTAVDQFRELFFEAVRCRMHGKSAVASMLSGGLDSSAITTVAAKIAEEQGGGPFRTYSSVFKQTPSMDESKYIDAVLSDGSYNSVCLPSDSHAPLGGIERMLTEQEGVYTAPGIGRSTKLYERAGRDGVSILLDGHGGDEVVGDGLGRIPDLAGSGQWLKMMSLIPTACRLSGQDPIELLQNMFIRFGPKIAGSRFFWAIARKGNSFFRPVAPSVFIGKRAWERCLNPDFIRRTGLAERIRDHKAQSHPIADERERQLKLLRSDLFPFAFENLSKATLGAGIEVRYPFYDRRLLEFCVNLPSSEKLRIGQTRSILRRALKEYYPKSVYTRQSKTRFGFEMSHGLVVHHNDILEDLSNDRDGRIAPYLNVPVLRRYIEELRADTTNIEYYKVDIIWKAACLYIWLGMGGSIQ